MSKKRRNHSPSPKAKVALEAAREERTTTEIAREYGVHVNQVSAWKRLLLAANAFTGVLQAAGVKISMDGRGAWRDNDFIERLWWTLKHEEVYLRAYDSVWEARHGISNYIDFYNNHRQHSSLEQQTPVEAYNQSLPAAPASRWHVALFVRQPAAATG